MAQLDLTPQDFEPIRQAYHSKGDIDKARSMVTAKMLTIGIAGTSEVLIERLEKLAELGVRHMSFGPPLGPDILAAIEAIGRDVIPRFRM